MDPILPSIRVGRHALASSFDGLWRMSSIDLANTAAFGALSAKADVLQAWDGQRFTNSGPVTDRANGRVFFQARQGALLVLFPYGVGADNDTFEGRVTLWYGAGADDYPQAIQWVGVPQGVFTGALCAKTGLATVAGGPTPLIENTDRYADTITITNNRGFPPLAMRVWGPAAADDAPVGLVVDATGAPLIEVEMRCTGTTTGINALYGFLTAS